MNSFKLVNGLLLIKAAAEMSTSTTWRSGDRKRGCLKIFGTRSVIINYSNILINTAQAISINV